MTQPHVHVVEDDLSVKPKRDEGVRATYLEVYNCKDATVKLQVKKTAAEHVGETPL